MAQLPATAALLLLSLAGRSGAEPADCGLPKAGGSCSQFAVRWYYDTEYGGCLRFWYGGCDGNGNRYPSEAACSAACVSPRGDDVCRLPAVRGACKRAKQRWFSDTASGACRTFTFSGCLGNDNRFESEDECRQRCDGVLRGRPYQPPRTPSRPPQEPYRPPQDPYRSPQDPYRRPQDPYRRPQDPYRPPQEPEKQASAAACLLPDRVAGDCQQYELRYSYVGARRQCAPFYYGGCGGNANSFATEDKCREACLSPPAAPRARQEGVAPRGREEGAAPRARQEEVTPRRRPYYRPEEPSGRAPYDRRSETPGRNSEERETEEPPVFYQPTEAPEPATEPPEVETGDVCSLPEASGRCRSYIPRFFYSSARRQCLQFIYGGCDGNANRFETMEACEARCGVKPSGGEDPAEEPTTTEEPAAEPAAPEPQVDLCSLPPTQGPCRAYQNRYYFNAALQRCFVFVFGGCGGNENRFDSATECRARCQPDTEPVPPPRGAPGTRTIFPSRREEGRIYDWPGPVPTEADTEAETQPDQPWPPPVIQSPGLPGSRWHGGGSRLPGDNRPTLPTSQEGWNTFDPPGRTEPPPVNPQPAGPPGSWPHGGDARAPGDDPYTYAPPSLHEEGRIYDPSGPVPTEYRPLVPPGGSDTTTESTLDDSATEYDYDAVFALLGDGDGEEDRLPFPAPTAAGGGAIETTTYDYSAYDESAYGENFAGGAYNYDYAEAPADYEYTE